VDDAPSVFLITGIQAAGKSTVADTLARRFERGVHLRGDAFRRMVVSGWVDMEPEETPEAHSHLDLRYRIAAAAADTYYDAGFTVALQDVVLGDHLARYVKYVRSRPLHVVVLTPRTDVVAEREAARNKTAYRVGSFTIGDLDRALRERTPHIGLWIDNSDQDPSDTVDEILGRLDEARI
jgi:cytidylate kinase